MRWWSLTQWLIAINVSIFVIDWLSSGILTEFGAFSAENGIFRLQIWRWVTCQFLHNDPLHLIFNMWALWIFGPPVEARLRRQSFIAFYLLSGLGGVLGYLFLWRLAILETTRETQLIGASACIFGCLVAAAHFAPNAIIRYVFPPITLRLRTIAWICVGLAIVVIARHGENSGGEAAHLGGAAVGFVLVRNMSWLNVMRIGSRLRRFWKPGDPASNFFRKDI